MRPTLSILPLVSLTFARAASACTLCESDTAQQVRAGLFDGNFLSNVALTLLPFPLLLAIVAGTYYGFPTLPGRRDRKAGE
ncbi:MAG: hypothetical protein V4671_28840 [Armatimonadota bacterium]